jgi:hypothetical protein
VSVSNAPEHRGELLARSVGTAVVSASYRGVEATVTVTVTAAEVIELQVAPRALGLPRGASDTLIATALYSDGSNDDVSADATWSSSDDDVAVVSAAGLYYCFALPE